MALICFDNKMISVAGHAGVIGTGALPPIPPFTVRCKYKAGTTPAPTHKENYNDPAWNWDSQTLVDSKENIWDITKVSTDWTRMLEWQDFGLIEVIGSNSPQVTNMFGLFNQDHILETVHQFDTSGALDAQYMFNECYLLVSLCSMDLSQVTTVYAMFAQCRELASPPAMNTIRCTNFQRMFRYATGLVNIPEIRVDSATNVSMMFYKAEFVETGILRAYDLMKDISGLSHSQTFYQCGSSTESGRAELAQLPPGWQS
jgi:hypothetical protein